MSATGVALADQFARSWGMLREAIHACPDTQWRSHKPASEPTYAPARQALHTIETVEFYLSDSPDEYNWGGRYSIDWENAETENLPTQDSLLVYADEVGLALQLRLRKLAVGSSTAFEWTGKNMAEHWLYVLRHTQHHVAVLGTILRLKGIASPSWK